MDVIDIYNKIPGIVTEGKNLRANFAGCLVRMAGHDFMDFQLKPEVIE